MAIFHSNYSIHVAGPSFVRAQLRTRIRRNFFFTIVGAYRADRIQLFVVHARLVGGVCQGVFRNGVQIVNGGFLSVGRSFLSFLPICHSFSIFVRFDPQGLLRRFLRDQAFERAVNEAIMRRHVNRYHRLQDLDRRCDFYRRGNVQDRLRLTRVRAQVIAHRHGLLRGEDVSGV